MATRHAVAAASGQAIDRLNAVKTAISEKLEIEDTTIPVSHRDPDLLRARQLEALATFNEKVAEALGIKVKKPAPPINVVAANIHPVGEQTPPNVVDDNETDEPDPSDSDIYDTLTVPELTALANQRGIDISNVSRKFDIIEAIRAADRAEDDSADNPDLSDLTIPDLKKLAEEKGIDLTGANRKHEIIERLNGISPN